MTEYLDITPGSVSVLGLMNDKDCKVQLLIDKDILQQEYIGCHPCVNTASLKISLKDLLSRCLPYIKYDITFVEL
ncbi:hypothetical protein acsn021_40160 [Anaerocolumna cellulosilytica]|uniref:Uncharacterized protein n=1 Tax=Anaerocolumna cellulosilytica TaxID=433286 RepID=A0A6S6R8M0_9FIRM|nr:hypothetical protein [Anaerocolumna cellulosilytica]BCJ96447.1 hypothetical protein acsn021_40160 [Anaerocolumna cellulosilytica]